MTKVFLPQNTVLLSYQDGPIQVYIDKNTVSLLDFYWDNGIQNYFGFLTGICFHHLNPAMINNNLQQPTGADGKVLQGFVLDFPKVFVGFLQFFVGFP